MRHFCFPVLFSLLFFLFSSEAVAQDHFYYSCGFEHVSDSAGWVMKKLGGSPSAFVIGKAVHRIGSYAMYVSADGGATAGYTSTSSGYNIVAYRKFHLKPGEYDMSFDFHMKGEAASENDVMRVAVIPATTSTGTPQEPNSTSTGSRFHKLATLYPFYDANGKDVFSSMGWCNVRGVVDIKTENDYYIAFYFKEAGGENTNYNPGSCIDNFDLVSKGTPESCVVAPSDVNVAKSNSSVDISWSGNAGQYEVLYRRVSVTSDTAYKVIGGITETKCSIPLSSVSEGAYLFRVRAVCGSDTSIWVDYRYFLVYDPAQHCLDYMNFHAEGVTCTSGDFLNPYQKIGVVDNLYTSKTSMHTVHYSCDEYDPRTNNGLKTVPDGASASVRLSNWTEAPSQSGSIEYCFQVSQDKPVLLLRYAAVFQECVQAETPEQHPSIKIEIRDEQNNRDTCAYANFNAIDAMGENNLDWHIWEPPQGVVQNRGKIMWFDWKTLGIDMSSFVGKKVYVRITLYACVYNFHFGYAYFTLECAGGELEGMACGETPKEFVAPEGFDYKWYRMSDPAKAEVGNERIFTPEPTDTNSYFVDLIYRENKSCHFTLAAYIQPRLPRPKVEFKRTPHDCANEVSIINRSEVYIRKKNPDRDSVTSIKPTSYFWDFGPVYGTSSAENPKALVFPNEGDTITVRLTAEYNGCPETEEFLLEVPALEASAFDTTLHICMGDSVLFNNEWYKAGTHTHSLPAWGGCDSILTIRVEELVPETISTDTAIFSDETYVFYGDTLRQSGQFTHTVPSVMGCDSIVHLLNLRVKGVLYAELGVMSDRICADDPEFLIPFTIYGGSYDSISISFSELALKAGFENIDYKSVVIDKIAGSDNSVGTYGFVVPLPDGVRPGRYSATIVFFNSESGNVNLTAGFDVLYPSSVLVQRWNDVIAVLNAENNGGYTFVAYQWFLSGTPVEGALSSNFYAASETLAFGQEYTVLLTRADDNVSVRTCPFVPVMFERGAYTEVVNVLFPGEAVSVDVPQKARACVYTAAGVLLSEEELSEGYNSVAMPGSPGIYLLRLLYGDGTSQTERIVVAY